MASKKKAHAMSKPVHMAPTNLNLLFGILALQMDFIDREQLIAAMQAWLSDKSKTLGAILVMQNVLNTPRLILLQALVEEHLKQHDNDPRQSLAAVGTIGSIQSELEKLADDDVNATLVTLREDRSGSGPAAEGGASSAGSAALRFRILRPHARGGLGAVFIAHDEELHREVALKEILELHAHSQSSRSRFLLEAEITGRLEHPGIVPVYGLGQYADGRPFYAMRFIKGDSLQDAIERFHKAERPDRDPEERAEELRGLLGRFIDVCDAIQYAHDRGVLHRDLKPGNIMLGKYGETLVVDWGLAKPMESREPASEESCLKPASVDDSAETLQGAAVGTPSFMSPEQAAGKIDQLGPGQRRVQPRRHALLPADGQIAHGQHDLADPGQGQPGDDPEQGAKRRLSQAAADQARSGQRPGGDLPACHGPQAGRPLQQPARAGRRPGTLAGRPSRQRLSRALVHSGPPLGRAAPHLRRRHRGGVARDHH